jgi:carotenoid cleavage dioxygenase
MSNRYLTDAYTPLQDEVSTKKLTVKGELPKELSGVFLRNGPNPHYIPKQKYHLFDGDGMLHGFYFNQGEIYYRNQWVKTERWLNEKKFEQSVFGGLLDYKKNRLTFNTVNRAYNTSNTNFIWHHGKCLSLWELGHPYEINPHDLTTIGIAPLSKHIQGAFSAHTKVDPVNNELISISYNGSTEYPACTLHRFDSTGHLIEFNKLDVPYRSMMHDFAFTQNYFIIPVLPAAVDFSGASAQLIQWSPHKPSIIGLASRKAQNRSIIWFTIPTCYVYHFANAFEEGDCIMVDAVVHEHPPLFTTDQNQNPIDPKKACLMRWKFDLKNNTFTQTHLDEQTCYYHFPVCDSRWIGQKYQTLFASAEENGYQIIRLDLKTKEKVIYSAKKDMILSEPVFIPRHEVAEEGLGYLACVASSVAQNKSELLFFDSTHLTEPMAIADLPHPIPFGFHGIWIPNISTHI